MKSLFVEAGSKGSLRKGVFVPTGLHLIEGKEVVMNILQAHQDFVQTTTSVQIEGIAVTDMYNRTNLENNTEKLLLDGPGVCSIESTHQTQTRGNWLIVVKQNRVQELGRYISTNIQQIYSNRQRQIPKLVGTNANGVTNSYRLIMMDITMSKIGTYAEVLKRQFTTPTTTEADVEKTTYVEQVQPTSLQGKEGSRHTPGDGTAQTQKKYSEKQIRTTDPPNNAGRKIHGITAKEPTHTDRQKRTTHSSVGKDTKSNVRQQTENNNALRKDTITQSQVEQMLTDKLAEINKTNQSNLQEIQDKMEAKIDRIIESRLRTATNLMADAVTNRIMASLKRIIPIPTYNGETDETDEGHVDENTSSSKDTIAFQEKVLTVTPLSGRKKSTISSTADMLNAIHQIENQPILTNDSPHDTTITESFPAPS